MTTSTITLGREQTSATNSQDEVPPTALVVGVAQERVDPYMLRIIKHLFPGDRGLKFLAELLRLAQAKQLALPDLGLPQVVDVAVVGVKNLRELAKTIGWSYDTTEKYVVVFCSLRLLWKQRDRQQITLHFPLSRPQLPEPEALDKLTEYRHKVDTFVKQIKKRLLLLRKQEETYTSTRSPRPFFENDEPRLLLEDIRRILQEDVDPERGKRLLFKIKGAIEYRCMQRSSRLSAQKDDFYEDSNASAVQPYEEKSTFYSMEVDSKVADLDQESLLSTQEGDFYEEGIASVGQTSEEKSTFQSLKVDSEMIACHGQNLPSAKKGDFLSPSAAQKSRLLDKSEDSNSPKGDFLNQKVDSNAANVNVSISNILKTLNVKVGTVAEYLRTIFGEPKNKRGFYHNLYTKRNCQKSDAWLAAAIETIVAIQRHPPGTIHSPGKYFYDRCLAIHQDGISPETAHLVSKYGSLSYQQLLVALQEAPSSKAVQKPSGTKRESMSDQKITLRIPRLPKGQQGMSHHSIKELVAMIKTGAQTKNMRYQPYRQNDGSGILLVEDWVGCQRWICSLEDWQAIVHTVQRSRWPQNFIMSDDVCKGVN